MCVVPSFQIMELVVCCLILFFSLENVSTLALDMTHTWIFCFLEELLGRKEEDWNFLSVLGWVHGGLD